MDLYMIRHGESLANFTGTHAGWAPVPLTEKGEAQAETARRHVRNLTFDRLYVSDVRRAQQTADILFPGVPRTFSTIIREINNTSMRGKTCDDMTALYGERYLACRKNFDYAPLGIDCESGAHMRARAQEFLDLVAAEETLTRVAAVAHAGLITAMAEVVLGARVGRQMSCGNASVSIFRCENNRWRLRLWNLTPDMD